MSPRTFHVSLSPHLLYLSLPGVRRFSPFRHGHRLAPGRAERPTLWLDTPQGRVASPGSALVLTICPIRTQPFALGVCEAGREGYMCHQLLPEIEKKSTNTVLAVNNVPLPFENLVFS